MWISVKGHIFELGFKIGFARGVIDRARNKELKEEWEKRLEELVNIAKVSEKELRYISKLFQTLSPEDIFSTALFRDREEALLELAREAGIPPSSKEEETQLSVYVTGLYGGELFAIHLPQGDIVPVVFDMFSENWEAGAFFNADLIFYIKNPRTDRKELHVYDLKLFGGGGHIRRFLTRKENTKDVIFVPPRAKGIQLSLSLGDPSLHSFAKALLKTGRTMLEREEVELDFETKSLIQVFSYLFDYLRESGDSFDRIHTGLITSTTDGVVFTFNPSHEELPVEELSQKFKELYRELKRKEEPYALKTQKELSIRRMNRIVKRLRDLKDKVHNEAFELEKEINKRDGAVYEIIPESRISQLRRDTERRTREFWKDPWGKVLVLLHSTGSGKTFAMKKVVLEESKEKLILLYFAPRIRLLEEVNKEAGKIEGVSTVFLYDSEEKPRRKPISYTRAGDIAEVKDAENTSRIRRAVREINRRIEEGAGKIACLLTTHSITKTIYSSHSTLWHVKKRMGRWRRKGYKVVLVFDELTGSKNGFASLRWAIELMQKYPDMVSIMVFDATLHSKGVFEKAWSEFVREGYVSPSFTFADFESEGEVELDGSRAFVYSGYSYPAKKLLIRERFILRAKDRDEIYDRCAGLAENQLKELRRKGERLYIYVQNREAVQEIRRRLEAKGFKILASTSNIRGSQEELERDSLDYDGVISTSTLSRGVSLRQNFTRALILTTHFSSIEENTAEDLQASARIRGMEGEEDVVKEIIRVYAFVEEENEELVRERARTYLESLMEEFNMEEGEESEEVQRETEELLHLLKKRSVLRDQLIFSKLFRKLYESYYSPSDKVVATISQQMRPLYTPEELSPGGQAINFLEELSDYYPSLTKEEMADIKRLASLITKMLSVLPDVEISKIGKETDFFHPYLLIDVDLRTSAEQRDVETALRLFEKHKDLFYRANRRTAEELEGWLYRLKTGRQSSPIYGLVYIPTLAIAYEAVERDFVSVEMLYSKYITRFGIGVLGAGLKPSARISRDPHSGSVRSVVFPVENSEVFGWLSGSYPKVGGDLLLALIEEVVG